MFGSYVHYLGFLLLVSLGMVAFTSGFSIEILLDFSPFPEQYFVTLNLRFKALTSALSGLRQRGVGDASPIQLNPSSFCLILRAWL